MAGVYAVKDDVNDGDAAACGIQRDDPFDIRVDVGHHFSNDELEALKRSITDMALSRVDGEDELYVGGLWALRRSDSLSEKGITHVLSMIGFNPTAVKSFKEVPWSEYGRSFEHLVIDVNDVDEEDILIELPKAVKFIDQALRGGASQDAAAADLAAGVDSLQINKSKHGHAQKQQRKKGGGIFVHCAAGKSRSATAVIAYLLWRYPERFDPNTAPISVTDPSAQAQRSATAKGGPRPRKDTADEAVRAALAHVQRTRPMAEPNPGFMEQLALWWRMGCPDDVEAHHIYQKWAYKREVEESTAVGQAPARLRFEDEVVRGDGVGGNYPDEPQTAHNVASLRCKKCRRTLATSSFFVEHRPSPIIAGSDDDGASPTQPPPPCQHVFIEPLSWMRTELEKGLINGRLTCPNERCGAGVGRYDWKGFKCNCGGWVVPALSLQRGRVDEVVARPTGPAGEAGAAAARQQMGIRMPPSVRRDGGNL